MSMIFCKHCDALIDTDFNAEHEDECSLNPENKDEDGKTNKL